MFKAPENWVKYNAAMVEYKSKVKLAANASASLDILVRAAGRGHRIRQPAKRYVCEVVHVCLLGFLRVRVCLPVLFLHACAQVCPSGPMGPSVPKSAHVFTHEGLRTSCVCQSFC